MKIIILNTLGENDFNNFFTPSVLRKLNQTADVVKLDCKYSKADTDILYKEITDTDVIFTGWGVRPFEKEFFDAAKKLKIIAHTGGSVADLVNQNLLENNHIMLLSGNRYYAESVAEATICYMLLGQRRLYPVLKETEKGWGHASFYEGLRGKTVGLLGFGMIAKEVCKMLEPFGVQIKVYAEYSIPDEEKRKYHIQTVSLETLFSESDIISIHMGMTQENYHLVKADLLSKMKNDALLINTARGAIIDEQALAYFAVNKKIRAVLDVFITEPLPCNSPLRELDNIVLVPHQGGPTTDVCEMVTMGLIEDIISFYDGKKTIQNEISMEYAKHMTSHKLVEKNKK